jgi:ubiquinone/menaquinone biosynthesis C-methylase UbiE
MLQSDTAASPVETARLITRHLAAPRTQESLKVDGAAISTASGAFKGEIRDDVAVMMNGPGNSFFDDKFEVMAAGHEGSGERAFCYDQQSALFSSYLEKGDVVLDVGCGPNIQYERPKGVILIGLEPSFKSIRANQFVDLRVFGSAYEIPAPTASVDKVVCFYSIHHMVGVTRAETKTNVLKAFHEFGRVLKPGGILFVFEMTPNPLFDAAQNLAWNSVRRLAPHSLDMFFWSSTALATVGTQSLPKGTHLEKVIFGTSQFTSFPPIFSLPWIKIPRFVYPLDARLYKWRVPTAGLPN